jgi:hypothetical protein
VPQGLRFIAEQPYWLRSQPDSDRQKGRALAIARELHYSTRITSWSAAQVHEVRERLAALPTAWGGERRTR